MKGLISPVKCIVISFESNAFSASKKYLELNAVSKFKYWLQLIGFIFSNDPPISLAVEETIISCFSLIFNLIILETSFELNKDALSIALINSFLLNLILVMYSVGI